MTTYERIFWACYAAGAAGTTLGCLALWLPKPLQRAGRPLLVAGWAALTAAAVARGLVAGRVPVIGTFENTLLAGGFIVLTAILISIGGPVQRSHHFARLLAPLALLTLAAGWLAPMQPLPISAGGRSWMGYVHALIGWADFAVLAGTLAAAVGQLRNSRAVEEEAWDETLARLLGLGFALLTATMASGSVYSYILFGEWYRWQVVETTTMAAWLAYAALLHLRLLHRWSGRRLAVATLAAFPLALVAFWIWAIYPDTYHYFDAALRVR